MFVNFGSPIVLSVLCFYFHYFRDEFPRRFQIKYQDKMSFIIISLSLVSYQDSSKVILTSTMAQNKLGRHHDNGKSFFRQKLAKGEYCIRLSKVHCQHPSEDLRISIIVHCNKTLGAKPSRNWAEESSECLLLFGQFLVASALGKEEDVRKYQG